MNQCCSRTSKCCPSESGDEAQNQDRSQKVAYPRTDDTVMTPFVSNTNVTEACNQAQNHDESNGQGAHDTVATPLMS